MPALNRTASVAEIVGDHAAAAALFRRGDATVKPGSHRELYLEADEALPEVDDVVAEAASELHTAGSSGVGDDDLLAHIAEHHAYTRRVLPYAVALLAKIVGRHGKRNAKLSALCDVGEELADRLDDQMEGEERDVFPALLARDVPPETLRRTIDQVLRNHSEVRMLLMRMRWLADGFVAPDWAGQSYRGLMEELAALEEDVLEHIHLERYLFLPRLSRRYLDAR